MEHYNDVFSFIKTEENAWKTQRVPLTSSKDWNMFEHIERCTNVSNGWFNQGKNDGKRPYDDIVTPIVDVAFRTEGFDVKDIVPYVDSIKENHKSFLIKKFHPQWAREKRLDDFIDEVVESSIVYDLVLVKKNTQERKPEVVPLSTLAFCDQTDVLASPLCIKHYYSIDKMKEMEGTWENVDLAIALAPKSKKVKLANDQEVIVSGKSIEVYELRGTLPKEWITKEMEDVGKFTPQMWVVCFYEDKEGNKNGIILYKGKDKPLKKNFKALKIDKVRSVGRACGRSVVERLFEPQVWRNYSAIKLKDLLDSAFNVLITDSQEIRNQKLKGIKSNTILTQEKGANTQRLTSDLSNIPAFQNYGIQQENSARTLGSANEAQLGKNPTAGTPFALQELVVQQGEGIHEYRQGKIATFFSDELYQDWILEWLTEDIKDGKKFSEELTLDEMIEMSETISKNEAENKIEEIIRKQGKVPTREEKDILIETLKQEFLKSGRRKFFELVKGDIKDTPIKVKVNIAGKQRYMAQNADRLSKLISNVLANPEAFAMIPGLGNLYNQLLEESGMNGIDFTPVMQSGSQMKTKQLVSPVGEKEVLQEKQ
jgi:hypothetical protein